MASIETSSRWKKMAMSIRRSYPREALFFKRVAETSSSTQSVLALPRSLSYVAMTVRSPGAAPDLCSRLSAAKSQKRWRSAHMAIRFARFMRIRLPPAANTGLPTPTATTSYVAIDVLPSDLHASPLGLHRPFNVDQTELTSMTRDKNLEVLEKRFGGINGLASHLHTHPSDGISSTGVNDEVLIVNRRRCFGSNHYKHMPPKSLISFVLVATKDPIVIALLACAALSLGVSIKQHGVKDGSFQGGSVLVAGILVIAVSVFANLKQSKLCTNDVEVQVRRNGMCESISANDVVVGDVVCLTTGNQVPADGLFLDGYSLTLDERRMTGESEHVEVNRTTNPFLFSGTIVTNGDARMLVTCVGMNTRWGVSNNIETDKTPLQARTREHASRIGKVGLVVGVLVFVVRARHMSDRDSDTTKMSDTDRAVGAISDIVAIFVVAMPEGLLLAVTLSLAHSVKKMMACGIQVRKLSACENIGSATVICTDMTGVITLKDMKVAEFWMGKEEATGDIDSMDIEPQVLEQLRLGVVSSTLHPTISGCSTEKAILSWAVSDLHIDIDQVREICEVINVEDFNSEKRQSQVLMKKNGEKEVHIHLKGVPEKILNSCSYYYAKDGTKKSIDEEERNQLQSIVRRMAAKSYRCIALAHKRIDQIENKNDTYLMEADLTLLGLLGLENPCRPGIKEDIELCMHAGVKVILVTGDNLDIAKALAIKCVILNDSGDQLAVQGSEFDLYSTDEWIDSISVVARASPSDKAKIVSCLKKKGHVVAYIGDSQYALKEAHVGISRRLQITSASEESSDLILLRDDFKSVVEAVRCGRYVFTNIHKFLQFHLTVNASAFLVTLIAACPTGEILLSAVKLSWVNLVIILGTWALGAQQPSDDTMMKRVSGTKLITKVMWRNIIGQTLFQVGLILTLYFVRRVNDTFIFNTFVLCQVMSMLNARKLEEKNIFKGLLTNRCVLGMSGIIVILQAMMIEFGSKFADTERLHLREWIACIGLAAMSWPVGLLAKYIPVGTTMMSCS